LTADLQKELIDERRIATGRISESCRYIGFGLLALYFAAPASDKGLARDMFTETPYWMGSMAAAAVAAVIFDYAQYAFSWRAIHNAMDNKNKYIYASFPYRAAFFCFVLKQLAIGVGAIVLVSLVVWHSIPDQPPLDEQISTTITPSGASAP